MCIHIFKVHRTMLYTYLLISTDTTTFLISPSPFTSLFYHKCRQKMRISPSFSKLINWSITVYHSTLNNYSSLTPAPIVTSKQLCLKSPKTCTLIQWLDLISFWCQLLFTPSWNILFSCLLWHHSSLVFSKLFNPSQTSFEDSTSSTRPFNYGVSEASLLSPLLYSLYIISLCELIHTHGFKYHPHNYDWPDLTSELWIM